MDKVTVDGFGMRHLSHGFRSNSLHLERKIALADDPTQIRRETGEHEGTKKKRQRDESKELLTLQGRDERRTSVVE
jgi:hypothetical protein